MKITIFEVEPWEREAFRTLEENGYEVRYAEGPLELENAPEYADSEVISTFIYTSLSRELLAKFPNLQLVATRSTGVDHIDVEYCRDKGIKVANVPTYGENTVAEHVFALLLAISHRLIQAVDRTRRGDFSPKGLQGFDLEGKTLGVIGTGNIGQHVIRIANGFGMKVVAFDTRPDEALARDLGFDYLDMPAVLSRADIVTLHVPGGKATRHLISSREFEQMKDGTILINTSRGTVVDVRSLLHALAGGKVGAVGLDVLPEEPVIREEAELLRAVFAKEHDLEALLADHILLRLRNVGITPHSAFNTREAVQRILDTTCGNIDSFARGNPQNLVD